METRSLTIEQKTEAIAKINSENFANTYTAKAIAEGKTEEEIAILLAETRVRLIEAINNKPTI